jgi:hypothetical protein
MVGSLLPAVSITTQTSLPVEIVVTGGYKHMIYFIEFDTAGNICHVCSDPVASITPLINRVTKADGTPYLSHQGLALVDPVGISLETYTTLMSGGIANFTYDQATQTVVKKVAPSA